MVDIYSIERGGKCCPNLIIIFFHPVQRLSSEGAHVIWMVDIYRNEKRRGGGGGKVVSQIALDKKKNIKNTDVKIVMENLKFN